MAGYYTGARAKSTFFGSEPPAVASSSLLRLGDQFPFCQRITQLIWFAAEILNQSFNLGWRETFDFENRAVSVFLARPSYHPHRPNHTAKGMIIAQVAAIS